MIAVHNVWYDILFLYLYKTKFNPSTTFKTKCAFYKYKTIYKKKQLDAVEVIYKKKYLDPSTIVNTNCAVIGAILENRQLYLVDYIYQKNIFRPIRNVRDKLIVFRGNRF